METAEVTWSRFPSPELRFRLEGERFSVIEGDRVLLHGPGSSLPSQAVASLFSGEDHLLSTLDVVSRAGAEYILDILERAGKAVFKAFYGGRLIATAHPKVRHFFPSRKCDLQNRRLSRFAFLRPAEDGFRLDSPDAPCTLEVNGEFVLAIPRLRKQFDERELSCVEHVVAEILSSGGFLDALDETPEERTWEFHDRLFHMTGRNQALGEGIGATYRFKSEIPPFPAISATSSEGAAVRILAEEPDGSATPLGKLLRRRKSNREVGEPPIAGSQLLRLLNESARTTSVIKGDMEELLRRPYPSGGAIHELQFYAVANNCDGLEKGLYSYNSLERQLCRLRSSPAAVDALLDDARRSLRERQSRPQVLIIIASRLPRIAWKYEGIAYRISLLNAGVALQTLYLVSTEMNLNCTALGFGSSATFAAATGLNEYAETSIAEFVVGAPDSH